MGQRIGLGIAVVTERAPRKFRFQCPKDGDFTVMENDPRWSGNSCPFCMRPILYGSVTKKGRMEIYTSLAQVPAGVREGICVVISGVERDAYGKWSRG